MSRTKHAHLRQGLREFPLHFTSHDCGNSSKSLGIGEMNVPCTTPQTMVFDKTVSSLHGQSRCNGSTRCIKNKGQSTQIDTTMVPCLLPKSFLPVISYLYSMQYGDTVDCDNEDRFLPSGVLPCNEVPNCHSGCISAIDKAYDAAHLQNGKHNVEENGGQGIHETASVVNHDYSYLISPFQNKENQGHNKVQTGDILIPEKCGYYDPNDLFKREAYSAINKANDANHLQNGKGNIEENQGQGIHETASVMNHDCFYSISPFQDKENQDHSEVQTGNTLAPVKCNYYDPNVLLERGNAIKGNDGNHSPSDMGSQVIISDHEISSSHDHSISETQIMAKGHGSSSILVHKMHTIEEDVNCNHEKKALDEAVDDHSHASSKAWSVPILYDGFENRCFKNEKHAVKGDVDDDRQAEIEKCTSLSVNASSSTIMENKEEALEKDVIHIMLNGNNTILHKDLGQANTKFCNIPMYDGFEDACFQNEKYAREHVNGHHQAMIGGCTVNGNTLDSATMEVLTKDVSHVMLKGNNVVIERNLYHHSQNEIESLLVISSNDASDAMHPEDKEVSAPANVDNKDQHRHENEICVDFSDCNETESNTTQDKKS
ncbi:hypothetical protein KP509_05G082900 [Ceratopteris richardii]|uniref:Uncharacterized protein n=1 Tax=Ceratopteris richardii TaxID=49495 RepID=A0A8T2V069_CERRI|nr:hypothetical protein KP509_05G082900 [Ceratopteris richardii]